MRCSFKIRLSKEDLVFFEQFAFKKFQLPGMLMTMPFIFIIAVYDGIAENAMPIITGALISAATIIIAFFLYYKIGLKRKVEKYIRKEPLYLAETEITIDDGTLESRIASNEGETNISTAYPYSVITVIYETEGYFFFRIANEAKLLPKDKIPQEMREAVFQSVRKSGKCTAVK